MAGKVEALRRQLLADLHQGVYPVKSLMPSRNQLVRKYGYSRSTVDRVIKTLIAEQRLSGEQGRGTYVLPPPAQPIQRLFVSCHWKSSDMESFIRDYIFQGGDSSLPLRGIFEDEVPLHLAEITAPGSAMIWNCPSMYQVYCMRLLEQAHIPQFLINRNYSHYDSIATDQFGTLMDGLTWLMIEGGRDVAVLSFQPSPDRPYLYDRVIAFFECAGQLGIHFGNNAIHCREFNNFAAEIVEVARQLFGGAMQTPAVAILQHEFILPFVTAAMSLGRTPGQDYKLLCFDCEKELLNYPGVCMIKQRIPYMGQEAYRWLEARQRGETAPYRQLIKGEMIICGA